MNLEMKIEEVNLGAQCRMLWGFVWICGVARKQIKNKPTYLMQDFVHPPELYQVYPSLALFVSFFALTPSFAHCDQTCGARSCDAPRPWLC